MVVLKALFAAFWFSFSCAQRKDIFGPIFATKTSYFVNLYNDTSNPLPEGSTPILFWHFARHGARYFADKVTLDYQEDLPSLRDELVDRYLSGEGSLDQATILQFLDWKMAWTVSTGDKKNTTATHKVLSPSGHKENREQGERWRKRLDGAMKWDPERTQIFSSEWERTMSSGSSFAEGLLGQDMVNVTIDNLLCRSYRYCKKYDMFKLATYNNKIKEVKKFETYGVWQSMGSNIQAKTGLNLTDTQIKQVWQICRMEIAWSPESLEASPWCSLFSHQDLEVWLFRQDMLAYHQRGYGVPAPLTKITAVPPWKDLVKRLDEIILTGDAKINTVGMFGHRGSFQPFIVSLGLFEDAKPIKASDYPARDRQWKTSEIVPFSAAIDIIVYKLKDTDVGALEPEKDDIANKYRVALFHKERRIAFPGEVWSYSIKQFLRKYQYMAEMDFDQVCKVD